MLFSSSSSLPAKNFSKRIQKNNNSINFKNNNNNNLNFSKKCNFQNFKNNFNNNFSTSTIQTNTNQLNNLNSKSILTTKTTIQNNPIHLPNKINFLSNQFQRNYNHFQIRTYAPRNPDTLIIQREYNKVFMKEWRKELGRQYKEYERKVYDKKLKIYNNFRKEVDEYRAEKKRRAQALFEEHTQYVKELNDYFNWIRSIRNNIRLERVRQWKQHVAKALKRMNYEASEFGYISNEQELNTYLRTSSISTENFNYFGYPTLTLNTPEELVKAQLDLSLVDNSNISEIVYDPYEDLEEPPRTTQLPKDEVLGLVNQFGGPEVASIAGYLYDQTFSKGNDNFSNIDAMVKNIDKTPFESRENIDAFLDQEEVKTKTFSMWMQSNINAGRDLFDMRKLKEKHISKGGDLVARFVDETKENKPPVPPLNSEEYYDTEGGEGAEAGEGEGEQLYEGDEGDEIMAKDDLYDRFEDDKTFDEMIQKDVEAEESRPTNAEDFEDPNELLPPSELSDNKYSVRRSRIIVTENDRILEQINNQPIAEEYKDKFKRETSTVNLKNDKGEPIEMSLAQYERLKLMQFTLPSKVLDVTNIEKDKMIKKIDFLIALSPEQRSQLPEEDLQVVRMIDNAKASLNRESRVQKMQEKLKETIEMLHFLTIRNNRIVQNEGGMGSGFSSSRRKERERRKTNTIYVQDELERIVGRRTDPNLPIAERFNRIDDAIQEIQKNNPDIALEIHTLLSSQAGQDHLAAIGKNMGYNSLDEYLGGAISRDTGLPKETLRLLAKPIDPEKSKKNYEEVFDKIKDDLPAAKLLEQMLSGSLEVDRHMNLAEEKTIKTLQDLRAKIDEAFKDAKDEDEINSRKILTNIIDSALLGSSNDAVPRKPDFYRKPNIANVPPVSSAYF